MKFTDIVPYYSEFKAGYQLACAYTGGAISTVVVFFIARLMHFKADFERIAAFCFIAAGVIWLMPLLSLIPAEYANFFLLGTILLSFPFVRLVYEMKWLHTFLFWLGFSLTQAGIYLYLINR